jgi:acetyl esterase/lipase
MRVGISRLLPPAASLLLLAVSLQADPAIDLKRITPVPAGEVIPVSDFFRPSLLQQPRLNPSGTYMAAIITAAEDRRQLLVYGLQNQKVEIVGGPIQDSDIYEFAWLNDQRLVFQVSTQKLNGVGLFAANIGALGDAYPLLQYYNTSLVAVPVKNRLRPLVWNAFDGLKAGQDLGVASVNTDIQATGKAINLLAMSSATWDSKSAIESAVANNEKHLEGRYPLPGPDKGTGYMADKEGRLEFAFTIRDGQRSLYRLAGGQWLKCPVNVEGTAIFGTGNEPGQLVALGPSVDGKPRPLQFLDAVTGKFGDVLISGKAYDFTGHLYRDPISQDIIGAISQREGPHATWFSDAYSHLQKLVNGYFPGMYVEILGSNEAQNLFLVATYSDRQPARYSWIDLEKRTGGLIKESRPWIDAKRMLAESVIKYQTRDGHPIDAYLTLPAGASKSNLPPLVVIPHGGPWLRENWGYDPEAQFLASRGYAVLKPNYRGSLGYDWMFPAPDLADFLKMHHDVTDATKAVIGMGLVDPRRVAIMGGSFGGYLALQGAVNEPALYRCAVTIAGVFDWEQLLSDQKSNYDHFGTAGFGYMLRRLGDPRKEVAKFDAIAPVRHVDRIRVPVFVSHGGYDPIADIGQSTRLLSELEKHHVVHESYIVSTETHGMKHLANQVELYTRIEAFLAKNLAPLPAGSAAGAP